MLNAGLVTWGTALVVMAAALWSGWRPLRQLHHRRRREKLISQYGLQRLDNLMLEDGMGGQRVLEHLLLRPDGLLLLLPRHCEGALFGGDHIDSWTQMVGGRSYHFVNPQHQLDELLSVLRYQLPGIPVEGRILFSGDCRFPKGRPGRLLLLDELAAEGSVEQAVVPVLDQAWEKLRSQPRAEASEEEPAYRVSAPRLWFSAFATLAVAAWLGWRLL